MIIFRKYNNFKKYLLSTVWYESHCLRLMLIKRQALYAKNERPFDEAMDSIEKDVSMASSITENAPNFLIRKIRAFVRNFAKKGRLYYEISKGLVGTDRFMRDLADKDAVIARLTQKKIQIGNLMENLRVTLELIGILAATNDPNKDRFGLPATYINLVKCLEMALNACENLTAAIRSFDTNISKKYNEFKDKLISAEYESQLLRLEISRKKRSAKNLIKEIDASIKSLDEANPYGGSTLKKNEFMESLADKDPVIRRLTKKRNEVKNFMENLATTVELVENLNTKDDMFDLFKDHTILRISLSTAITVCDDLISGVKSLSALPDIEAISKEYDAFEDNLSSSNEKYLLFRSKLTKIRGSYTEVKSKKRSFNDDANLSRGDASATDLIQKINASIKSFTDKKYLCYIIGANLAPTDQFMKALIEENAVMKVLERLIGQRKKIIDLRENSAELCSFIRNLTTEKDKFGSPESYTIFIGSLSIAINTCNDLIATIISFYDEKLPDKEEIKDAISIRYNEFGDNLIYAERESPFHKLKETQEVPAEKKRYINEAISSTRENESVTDFIEWDVRIDSLIERIDLFVKCFHEKEGLCIRIRNSLVPTNEFMESLVDRPTVLAGLTGNRDQLIEFIKDLTATVEYIGILARTDNPKKDIFGLPEDYTILTESLNIAIDACNDLTSAIDLPDKKEENTESISQKYNKFGENLVDAQYKSEFLRIILTNIPCSKKMRKLILEREKSEE